MKRLFSITLSVVLSSAACTAEDDDVYILAWSDIAPYPTDFMLDVFAAPTDEEATEACRRTINPNQAHIVVEAIQQGVEVEAQHLTLSDAYVVALIGPNDQFAALMNTRLARDLDGKFYALASGQWRIIERQAQTILFEEGCEYLDQFISGPIFEQ